MDTATKAPELAPEETTEEGRTLTAHDRCDRCRAQAYVEVVFKAGNALLFCRHHFLEFEPKLRKIAIHIKDETQRLFDENRLVDDEDD